MQEKRSTTVVPVQTLSAEGTTRPVSALRGRMLAVMAEREFSAQTQAAYVRAVLGMVQHCGGRSPEAITVAEARAYLGHLKVSGASAMHVSTRRTLSSPAIVYRTDA